MVVSFACYLVFYEIGRAIKTKQSESEFRKESESKRVSEFDSWIGLYTDSSNEAYYEKYLDIINYRANKLDDNQKKYLTKIFVQACQFEYRFLDELL